MSASQNPIEKKVLYGTKQSVVVTPREGHEIEEVVIYNQTTQSVVPSQLTKTSDNPVQYVCTFCQPAGVISIRTKTRPVYYSVFIETCENCSVVLLESNDEVEVRVVADCRGGATGLDDDDAPVLPQSEGSANFPEPQHSPEHAEPARTEEASNVEDNEIGADAEVSGNSDGQAAESDDNACVTTAVGDDDGAAGCEAGEASEARTEEEERAEKTPGEEMDAEGEERTAAGAVLPDESLYDKYKDDEYGYSIAGIDDELEEDGEPIRITQAEQNRRNRVYWKWRNAVDAGTVSKEEFAVIKKKHFTFLNNVSAGRIIVIDDETD